jgi:glycine/D-amino acid oxidase-like deaminating enzyme
VCEQFDHCLAARHVSRWLHGTRPVSVDGFPLIGRCGLDGLIFATGTHRDGFHCSPAIAAHVAHDILHGPTTDDRFTWCTPERPPIQTLSLGHAAAGHRAWRNRDIDTAERAAHSAR